MSNYGISILITILVTSLIAFYLLYKARQLNLGILISISIGSVFLGFTFAPIYNFMLQRLSAGINAKIALVLSIFAVLVIFLSLILVISYIASITIPKKIALIDCCAAIDRFRAKIKEEFTKIIQNIRKILGNLPALAQRTKNYTYSLQNKLKKPVDTKQIIDTMGIEKIEIADPANDFTEVQETIAAVAEAVTIDEDTAFSRSEQSEPQLDEITEDTDNLELENILPPVIPLQSELPESEEESESIVPEPNGAEEEIIVETEDLEKLDTEIDIAEIDTYEDLLSTDTSTETETEQNEGTTTENDQFVEELQEVAGKEDTDGIDSVGKVSDMETTVDNELIDNSSETETVNAESYIIKAFGSKDQGNKVQAIDYYFKALELEPHDDMIFWIALDICTLYKQLGMSDLATIILEGLVDQYGSIIQPEIKIEIMKNLNTEND